MKLIWLPEAGDDIDRLFEFLLEKNPGAARRAVLTIVEGANRLLAHPQSGSRMDDDTERRDLFLPFGAGAYVLRYRVHYETVVVIRVWHSREDRGQA